jgi:hypothetical protein
MLSGIRTCKRWLVVLVPLAALSGCFFHQGAPSGTILVGHPEVFTRQRLVNRRLTEQQWLEEQLRTNTPTASVLQGYRDVREFSGIYSKTGVTVDPTGGAVSAAQSQLALQNLKNQTEVAELQRRLDTLVLQQKIQSQQQTPLTGTTTTVATPQGTATSAPAAPPPPGASTPAASGVFNNAPALPSPADVVETKAKLTSTELLRDQLAWRNAVQAALREQELDDSHDLDGYTLYTLKFDISILVPPGVNTAYAKVQLGEATPVAPKSVAENPTEVRTKYDSWLWHLRAAVRKEAVAVQRHLELDLLSEEEKIRIATAAAVWAERPDTVASSFLSKLISFLLKPQSVREQETPAVKSDAKAAIARLISEKYRVALEGLVDICETPIKISLDESAYYVPNIRAPRDIGPKDPCPEAPLRQPNDTLTLFEQKLNRDTKVTVFVADPKEEAQNISDVAAIEQLRNIVLSLQALVPQVGLSANTYNEYLNRSQQRLQAILRRPLVVAYSDGKKFGWIVGPRFELGRHGKPVFNQTTVQRSVQASLVVPGATRKLRIPYETCWIGLDGKETCDATGKSFEASLPGDDAAITTRLLADTGTRRLPYVEPPINARNQRQVYRLQANNPGELVIRGANLWRNPAVFIGGQPAETVKVLPDMSGLRVRIDKVVMPPAKAKENPFVDLTVVTSEGIATLRDIVQIVSDTNVAGEKLAATLELPRVFAASAKTDPSALAVSVPLEALPDGFYRVVLKVRPLLSGEEAAKVQREFETVPGEVSLEKQEKKAVFRTPLSLPGFAEWRASWRTAFANNAALLANGWTMQAKLYMIASPGQPEIEIAAADGKTLVFAYFPTAAAAHGMLEIPGVAPPPKTEFNNVNGFTKALVVTLGNDDVFVRGYPGLGAALQSILTIRIAEINNDTEVASTRLSLTSEHFELQPKSLPLRSTPVDEFAAKTRLVISSLPGSKPTRGDKADVPTDQGTGAAAWLRERLKDGLEHTFRLSIVVSPGVEVRLDPVVIIAKTPQQSRGGRAQPTTEATR